MIRLQGTRGDTQTGSSTSPVRPSLELEVNCQIKTFLSLLPPTCSPPDLAIIKWMPGGAYSLSFSCANKSMLDNSLLHVSVCEDWRVSNNTE